MTPQLVLKVTFGTIPFARGEGVQSLMQRYEGKASTILDHLARYAAAGHALRSDHNLLAFSSATPDQQSALFAAFDELGTAYLKPNSIGLTVR